MFPMSRGSGSLSGLSVTCWGAGLIPRLFSEFPDFIESLNFGCVGDGLGQFRHILHQFPRSGEFSIISSPFNRLRTYWRATALVMDWQRRPDAPGKAAIARPRVGRTPIGVIRCRSSLRSVRTVLENTILTAVSTVALTVMPTGAVGVIVLGQRPNRQGTG